MVDVVYRGWLHKLVQNKNDMAQYLVERPMFSFGWVIVLCLSGTDCWQSSWFPKIADWSLIPVSYGVMGCLITKTLDAFPGSINKWSLVEFMIIIQYIWCKKRRRKRRKRRRRRRKRRKRKKKIPAHVQRSLLGNDNTIVYIIPKTWGIILISLCLLVGYMYFQNVVEILGMIASADIHL